MGEHAEVRDLNLYCWVNEINYFADILYGVSISQATIFYTHFYDFPTLATYQCVLIRDVTMYYSYQ